MRVSGRIDHNAVEALKISLLYFVDQSALGVRLKKLDFNAKLFRAFVQKLLEITIRLAAVDIRLADPQHIHIRPIDNQKLHNASRIFLTVSSTLPLLSAVRSAAAR